MNIEYSRYRIKPKKSEKVKEWLAFLNDNMGDVLLTLEDEKMKVECIFHEWIEGHEYMAWFSVQSDGGQDVMESESWIDKKHLEYWKECIDKEVPAVDLTPEVIMIPDRIKRC